MDWNTIKSDIENDLDNAGITGDARKVILRFERRLNTARNFLARGNSWESMCFNCEAYDQAADMLNTRFVQGDAYNEPGDYAKEWAVYCKEIGVLPSATIGDWLA